MMTAPSVAMTRLQKMRAKMMMHQPFFATMLARMPMVETNEIPTAATDMETIFVNPAFIDTLEDDVVSFVIAHELSHRMWLHGLRIGGRNPDKWNRACDYAINWMLKESGFTIWEHALIDAQYKDMSADQIYHLLPDNGGGGNAGGMLGDIMAPKGTMSPAREAKIKRAIQQGVAQAATIARRAGKVPGGLERMINDILDPKVPWPVLLRDYMTRLTPDDLEAWNRRNRRFSHVFLPSRSGFKMGPIVAIGDTSGSIGNEELKQCMGEVTMIAEDLQPENIRMVWADTKVAGEQLFEEGDIPIAKPKGGGGTDMRVPLEYVERYDPELVILFTDGYTPWPTTEPPYPLIVCCTTNVDCPVGQVIRI